MSVATVTNIRYGLNIFTYMSKSLILLCNLSMPSSISDPVDLSTIVCSVIYILIIYSVVYVLIVNSVVYVLKVYSVVYMLIVYGGFPDKCGGGANPVRGITRMDASIASLNTQQANS